LLKKLLRGNQLSIGILKRVNLKIISRTKKHIKKKVILINLEGPIVVAKFILPSLGVQNLFCPRLECKIYFALAWSAKFILPSLGEQLLFCSPIYALVILQPDWNACYFAFI